MWRSGPPAFSPARLILPTQDAHRPGVPLIASLVCHAARTILGSAIHEGAVRVHPDVHAMEVKNVTFLQMFDNDIFEVSLHLHNLELSLTTVPNLLRFELRTVRPTAHKLTARFVRIHRARPLKRRQRDCDDKQFHRLDTVDICSFRSIATGPVESAYVAVFTVDIAGSADGRGLGKAQGKIFSVQGGK
jgi:hypothetical protein